MAQSSIEWTEMTWNPVTGCSKVSAGCKFCYAEAFAKRLQAMGVEKYRNGFDLTLQPESLEEPYRWKKSRIVFVNSMSDLFHEDVPINYIQRVFEVMNDTPQHIYQVLTKRGELLRNYDAAGKLNWTPNIWMGVSIEDERVLHRVDDLRSTGAEVKFLSCEPLIGPLPNLDLTGMDWVIVGGESGRKPRPMNPKWVREIRDNCQDSGVAFFFKQWGGTNKKKAGRELDGQHWNEMPEIASQLTA